MKLCRTIIIASLLARVATAVPVDWQTDYDKTLAKAKEEKKLVMVDLYTDWCGWCKRLDRDTYSDKSVETKLGKEFIALKVNPEKSVKGAQLAKQFGTRGYPHIVFLDAEGKKLSEIGGYLPAGDFLKRLNQIAEQAKKK